MNKRIRKKRIREVLLAELAFHFERTEDAIAWLDTPHPGLEGRSPRDAVHGGEVERVTLLLDQMNAEKIAHS